MNIREFDYQIPTDRIAQRPLKERDSSRLFVLHRKTGTFEHRSFRETTDYLRPGDVLVLNDTKVIPVRICGRKPSGGKAEVTLLKELSRNSWEGLAKGLNEGRIIFKKDISARISRINGTLARIDFELGSGNKAAHRRDIKQSLNDIGTMPLPVYIKRDAVISDRERYQTVYSRKEGAVAAPTAGLHFTDSLLKKIKGKGVEIRTITLHVGFGTFRPVEVTEIEEHKMDSEPFEIPVRTADAVNSAKMDGRRIIAVGTTVTRALEASASLSADGRIRSGKAEASIFIYPGYRFRVINALLTNFHLPKSTPMMLASAFAGLDLLKKAYQESEKAGYRLYSYGDAMLIV